MKKEYRNLGKSRKENIYNLPDALSIIRIILAFILVYMIFAGFNIITIVLIFIIAMLTDTLDGDVARIFKEKTEIGRKLDMIADRILLIPIVLSLIIKFLISGLLDTNHLIQMILVMTREIISLPFIILLFIRKKPLPHANLMGKATTVAQSISFPIIILSIFYSFFSFSLYFATATAIIGFFSAITFIKYILDIDEKREKLVKKKLKKVFLFLKMIIFILLIVAVFFNFKITGNVVGVSIVDNSVVLVLVSILIALFGIESLFKNNQHILKEAES